MLTQDQKKRGCLLGCMHKETRNIFFFIVYYDVEIKKFVIHTPKEDVTLKLDTYEELMEEIKREYTIETVSGL